MLQAQPCTLHTSPCFAGQHVCERLPGVCRRDKRSAEQGGVSTVHWQLPGGYRRCVCCAVLQIPVWASCACPPALWSAAGVAPRLICASLPRRASGRCQRRHLRHCSGRQLSAGRRRAVWPGWAPLLSASKPGTAHQIAEGLHALARPAAGTLSSALHSPLAPCSLCSRAKRGSWVHSHCGRDHDPGRLPNGPQYICAGARRVRPAARPAAGPSMQQRRAAAAARKTCCGRMQRHGAVSGGWGGKAPQGCVGWIGRACAAHHLHPLAATEPTGLPQHR